MNRKFVNPLAGGVKDRFCKGSWHRHHTDFADPFDANSLILLSFSSSVVFITASVMQLRIGR